MGTSGVSSGIESPNNTSHQSGGCEIVPASAAAHSRVRKVRRVRRRGAQTGKGTSSELRKEDV